MLRFRHALRSCPLTAARPRAGRRLACATAHCAAVEPQQQQPQQQQRRPQQAQVVVVGAGAAGLTATYFAAEEGAKVLVLERNPQSQGAGRKILVSGGARCNVLPLAADPARDFFTESSPSALRAVLASWDLEDCRRWLSSPDQLGIPLALEEETQKYFPASNSSKHVRDALLGACLRRGAAVRYGASLAGLRRLPGGGWAVLLEGGDEVLADRVVLATGGKSFPKLGATGTGYAVAAQLGHSLHPPYPALTPLIGRHPGGQQLAGVSLYGVSLTCVQPQQAQQQPAGGSGSGGGGRRRGGQQRAVRAQRSGLLFTHKGYSGPAILDLSHYVVKALERGEAMPELTVDWTGEGRAAWEQRLGGGGPGAVVNVLRKHSIPQRLAEALCQEAGVPLDRRLSELKKGERQALLTALTCWPLPITGHKGYALAEVTGGGVPLNEIDCSTMESRLQPGLHMCGEVLDVFGRIGGFNFLWAWVTGRAAGRAATQLAAAQPQRQGGTAGEQGRGRAAAAG